MEDGEACGELVLRDGLLRVAGVGVAGELKRKGGRSVDAENDALESKWKES